MNILSIHPLQHLILVNFRSLAQFSIREYSCCIIIFFFTYLRKQLLSFSPLSGRSPWHHLTDKSDTGILFSPFPEIEVVLFFTIFNILEDKSCFIYFRAYSHQTLLSTLSVVFILHYRKEGELSFFHQLSSCGEGYRPNYRQYTVSACTVCIQQKKYF